MNRILSRFFYSTIITTEVFVLLFFIQIAFPILVNLKTLLIINTPIFFLILAIINFIFKNHFKSNILKLNENIGRTVFIFLPFMPLIFLFPEYLIGEIPPVIITLIILSLVTIFFLMNLYFLKFQTISSKRNYEYLILSIVCSFYFLLILGINIFKYYNFSFVGRDVAAFIQSIWTFVSGKGFFVNTLEGGSHFGLHNSPILFFFVPFYYFFSHPITLFFLKCLIISLSPIPFYLIMKEHTGKTQSLILSIGILFTYHVFFQSFWEFYPMQLFPFFFLFAFYFSEKNNFGKYLFFLLLTLFIREDLFLITTAFSIYLLLIKKKPKWVIWTFIIGFAWYILSVKFVFPRYGNLYEAIFYKNFGNKTLKDIIINPGEIINLLLLNKKEKFLLLYLLLKQNGLFFIFISNVFIISIFQLMALLVTPAKYLVLHLGQYSIPIGVIFYLSASLGIIKLVKYNKIFYIKKEVLSKGLSSLLLLILLLSFSTDIIQPFLKGELLISKPYYAKDYGRKRKKHIKEAINIIPDYAPVCAPRYMLPMLANREKIFLLIKNLKNEDLPDYVILDNESDDEVTRKYVKTNQKMINESDLYKEIYNKRGIILFKKTDDTHPRQYHNHHH